MGSYEVLHDFAAPVATFAAACAAVFVTNRLGSRQVVVAQQQAETAKLQAAIAKQQADTALDRLRYDLFERRCQIYATAKELLIEVIRNYPGGEMRPSDVVPKLIILDEAGFFFPAKTCKILKKIETDCLDVIALYSERKLKGPESPEWLSLGERVVSEVTKLDRMRLAMPELFKDVLGFSQLTNPM